MLLDDAPGTPATRPPGPVVAGRYLLLDVVGAGATGTVHRAWDLRERREVAAKRVRRPDGGRAGADAVLRFVREQALRVQHPHVLAPSGWAAEDDEVLVVSPLVRGGSLDALLRRVGPLPGPWVARVLGQLLEALGAVHAVGLVHRDVKPANLLLEPTGTGPPHLLLADFGIATAARTHPGGARPVGTAGWLAPECRTGAPPDPRQDLWSAGAVARRALGAAAGAVGWRPVLDALLAPDPEHRPTTAGAALGDLRRLADLDARWDPRGMPAVDDLLGPPSGVPHHLGRGPAGRERAAAACLVASAGLSGAGAALAVAGRVLGAG